MFNVRSSYASCMISQIGLLGKARVSKPRTNASRRVLPAFRRMGNDMTCCRPPADGMPLSLGPVRVRREVTFPRLPACSGDRFQEEPPVGLPKTNVLEIENLSIKYTRCIASDLAQMTYEEDYPGLHVKDTHKCPTSNGMGHADSG